MKNQHFIFLIINLLLFSTISCQKNLDNDLTDNQRKILTIVLCSLMLFISPFLIIAGYRLFRHTVAVVSFVFAMALIFSLLLEYANLKWWVCLIIAGLSGLAFGLLMFYFYVVGFFIIGCFMGAILGLFILSTPIGTKYLEDSKIGQGLIVGLTGLAFGVMAVILQRIIIIIGTSIIGSYLSVVAIDELWVKTGVISKIFVYLIRKENPVFIIKDEWKVYVLLGVIAVLTIIGILTQLIFTSRRYHHRKPYGYTHIQSY